MVKIEKFIKCTNLPKPPDNVIRCIKDEISIGHGGIGHGFFTFFMCLQLNPKLLHL